MTDYDYQVIDKEGNITNYVWCDEMRKMMVVEKTMAETAVIYSNGSQECERMSMLLKSLNGEFHEYLLGVNFSDRQFRQEFGPDATYPQVALGSKHIGDMKTTLQYMKDKGLFV